MIQLTEMLVKCQEENANLRLRTEQAEKERDALVGAIHKAMSRQAASDKKQTIEQLVSDVAFLRRVATDHFDARVKAEARCKRLEEALREIRDYSAYNFPDEEIIASREMIIEESRNCTACQHAKSAKWPPSGLCEKHYSPVMRAHDKVTSMFEYKQTWAPQEIARKALEDK